MYDNIYTEYKDAKIIGYFNSFFVVPYLKHKIKKGEVSAQNYAYIAKACVAHGDIKNAFKYARKAIWYDRNYAYAYFVMGVLLREHDSNYSRAKKYFQKAFRLGGNNYYLAIYDLICCAAAEENNEERYKYETRFLDIDCDYPGYLLRKAYIYTGYYNYKKAFEELQKAFKSYLKYKHFPEFQYFEINIKIVIELLFTLPFKNLLNRNLAEYYMEIGKEEEACEILFKLAQKDNKKDQWSYRYLADYFWEQGEYKKVYDITNRMLISKKSAYAYYFKAISCWKLSDYEGGLELLDKAENLDKNQEFDNYDYWRSLMYCGMYDLNTALKYINHALLQKKNSENFTVKGQILVHLNKIEEANFCFKEADRLES